MYPYLQISIIHLLHPGLLYGTKTSREKKLSHMETPHLVEEPKEESAPVRTITKLFRIQR